MSITYVGFGSNLGDRYAIYKETLSKFESKEVGKVLRCSPLYETDPIDMSAETPPFLNAVIELFTTLEPLSLLTSLKSLEVEAGRERDSNNASRNLDLDILLYDSMVITEKPLNIPHPFLTERLFVMQPLLDLKPSLFHPLECKTIREIFDAKSEQLHLQKVRTFTP